MIIGTPPRDRADAVATGAPTAPVVPSTSRLAPLGLGEVTITGGPWARSQARNGEATLPHIGHWLEKAGWLANFDPVAAGGPIEGRQGREFADSEIYKYLEALPVISNGQANKVWFLPTDLAGLATNLAKGLGG